MNDSVENEVIQDQEQAAPDASPVVISVDNPSKEEAIALGESIVANYDSSVTAETVKFNFKKTKDKESKVETIREAVTLVLPYVSVQGLVEIIEGKHLEDGQPNKGLELLMDAMKDQVNAAARNILYEDLTLNAANFPVEKLSWEFIANIPKVQRRGGGIPKETWEAFAEDYVSIMPEATGKEIEAVVNASKCFLAKFGNCKTQKPVLTLLMEQLAIYTANSQAAGEFQDCVAFLLNKADVLLNTTDEQLLEGL